VNNDKNNNNDNNLIYNYTAVTSEATSSFFKLKSCSYSPHSIECSKCLPLCIYTCGQSFVKALYRFAGNMRGNMRVKTEYTKSIQKSWSNLAAKEGCELLSLIQDQTGYEAKINYTDV